MYYEYLLNKLVTYSQVDDNLRKTIDKGLISSLNRLQVTKLALKYFGVDENGNYTSDIDRIVNYKCPYSGKIGYDNLNLDHIIPKNSKGGTVLFNCIPVNDRVNISKHSNNLLTWWSSKTYFDYERLDRLVQYILEAYEIYDKEIIEEDDYIYEEENVLENQLDLTKSITNEEIEENKIDTRIDESVTYYQFITNLINKLSNDRNVDVYKNKLLKLKEENKFGELKEIDEIIKIVNNIIKEKIGSNNEIYLSYSLNINIKKLYSSLKTKEYEKEIRERFNKIEEILKQENKSFIIYFRNLIDIEEENILYFDSLDDKKINNFINSLKIDFDTKLESFIEMMADEDYTGYENGHPKDKNIFSYLNKVPFKGIDEKYSLYVRNFWSVYQDRIISKIEEKIKELSNKKELTKEEHQELEKYQRAKQAYETFKIMNQKDPTARIDLFIEMMADEDYTKYKDGKPTKENIFSKKNEFIFKGTKKENGLYVGEFWCRNQDKIIPKIEEKLNELSNKKELTKEEQEELKKYQKAKQAYKTYEIMNTKDPTARIDLFIEMMADEKETYTKYKDGKPTKENIFSQKNEFIFKGIDEKYGLYVGQFWQSNQDKIIPKIGEKLKELSNKKELTKEEQEELEKYQKAKQAYKTFEIMNPNDPTARIDLFIEMMADEDYTKYKDGKLTKENIFSRKNEFIFKGTKKEYGLYVGTFWNNNSIKYIIPLLFFSDQYEPNKYDIARENTMKFLNYLQRKHKEPEFNNIYEYILTLDSKKKEVKALIELRDKKLNEKKEFIEENEELEKNISNTSIRRVI